MEKRTSLPDGELEIMQIVWAHEPPVSRSVIEEMLRRTRPLAPSTILTFLSRLCARGFLSVTHEGRTNLYSPLISQRDYLAGESRRMLDLLYGGSLSAFAVSLSDSGVTKEELDELRALLEEGAL